MNHSKHKEPRNSKKLKTQPSSYSPFDQSIIQLTLSKIHKALHDIAKAKFPSLTESLHQIHKDLNAISPDSKFKEKLHLLIAHLHIFQMLQNQKFPEALYLIKEKSAHFNEKTHKIIKLSLQLLEALILKHLQRQEESKHLIQKAINHLNLTDLKIKTKSSQQKIIESTILCISITADHFAKFQVQSFDFRQIYTEAYKIAHKYLTQYHKLTETLFAICRKFPVENGDQIRKSKKKPSRFSNKRTSLNLNQNRYFLKDSTSQRSYLNHTIQPQSFNTINDSSDFGSNIRHTQIPKRLKTIEPMIDLKQEKELCLSKLYGTDLKQVKEKTLLDKKYLKKAKISSSLKNSPYEPHDAVEMKELEKISKMYLPRLEGKKRDMKGRKSERKSEKLNAADVLKFSSTLSKLKPGYFDRIKTQINERNSYSEAKYTAIDSKQVGGSTKKIQKGLQNSHALGQNTQNTTNPFETLQMNKQLKEKLMVPLKEDESSQTKQNQEQNCQLI